MACALSLPVAAQRKDTEKSFQNAAFTISYQPSTLASPPTLTLQQGHSSRALALAFAPGRNVLATGGQDGTARLWDLTSGQLLLTLPHGSPVIGLAFSADGRTLTTFSTNLNLLRFWDAQTGKPLGQALLPSQSSSVFAGNGRTARAYSIHGQVQEWDMRTGTLQTTHAWQTDGQPRYGRPLAFTPDGKALVFQREEEENENGGGGSPPNTPAPIRYKIVNLELTDAETGKAMQPLQPFEMRSERGYYPLTVFAPDGSSMALASRDTSARLWNLKTGRLLPPLKGNGLPITLLAFSPDGKRLATASEEARKEMPGAVDVWDTGTGKRLFALPGTPETSVRALAFSRDSRTLAVSLARTQSNKQTVRLWDAATGQPRGVMTTEMQPDALIFSPDSGLLVGSDGDGVLRAWNTQTGRQSAAFAPARPLYTPAVSPDGARAAVCASNGWMQIWDLANGHLTDSFPAYPQFSPTARYLQTDPIFAPNGQAIAYVLARNGTVEIYDLNTKQRRAVYAPGSESPAAPNRILFSPDSSLLAISARDKKTRFVRIADGKTLGAFDYEMGLANPGQELTCLFTPDSKSFVGIAGSSIVIVNAPDGSARATIAPGRSQEGVRLSQDGSLLAVTLDREVQVYDVATGALKSTLKVTDGEYLYGAILSPDGRLVMTRGTQAMRLWDIATGQVFAQLEKLPPNGEFNVQFSGYANIVLAFAADGKAFGMRLPSGRVIVWNTQSGKRVPLLNSAQLAGFPVGLRRPLAALGASLAVTDPRGGSPLALLTAFPSQSLAEQVAALDQYTDENKSPHPYEWLAQTLDGYFDASPGAAPFLRWNVNGTLFPLDRYAVEFRQADRVQKALNMETAPPPP